MWHHEYHPDLAPLPPLSTFPPQVGSLLLDGVSSLPFREPLHCHLTPKVAMLDTDKTLQDNGLVFDTNPGSGREGVDI